MGRLGAFFRKTWVRRSLGVIGLVALCLCVWFGFWWLPGAVLPSVWFRLAVIGLILLTAALIVALRLRARRNAAAKLEENLLTEPVGDSALLAERMQDALSRLK